MGGGEIIKLLIPRMNKSMAEEGTGRGYKG